MEEIALLINVANGSNGYKTADWWACINFTKHIGVRVGRIAMVADKNFLKIPTILGVGHGSISRRLSEHFI